MELGDWLTPLLSAVAAFLGAVALRALDTKRDLRRDKREDARRAADQERDDAANRRKRREDAYTDLLVATVRAMEVMRLWTFYVTISSHVEKVSPGEISLPEADRFQGDITAAAIASVDEKLALALPTASSMVERLAPRFQELAVSYASGSMHFGSSRHGGFSAEAADLAAAGRYDEINPETAFTSHPSTREEWRDTEKAMSALMLEALDALRVQLRDELDYKD